MPALGLRMKCAVLSAVVAPGMRWGFLRGFLWVSCGVSGGLGSSDNFGHLFNIFQQAQGKFLRALGLSGKFGHLYPFYVWPKGASCEV